MKKNLFILITIAIAQCAFAKENFLQYVNPTLGSVQSRWFFFSPASIPFGMAKLGASTNGTYGNKNGWEAVGYDDEHQSIDGFPCLHEFQIGGIALFPVTGECLTNPGILEHPMDGWRSTFRKQSEIARPGYYSVYLDRYRVRTELTATARVGYMRFSFPKDSDSHILFNIGNRMGESGAVKDARIQVVDAHTIQGYVISEPEYVKKYQAGSTISMFFYAQLSRDFKCSKVTTQGSVWKTGNEINGPGAIMLLDYDTQENEQIEVKIGLSYTNIENAKQNLLTETKGKSFSRVQKDAEHSWRKELKKIQVKGSTIENRTKFYTGLYHALLGRGLASDKNGDYPRNDGSVGHIPIDSKGQPLHHHYNTDAIWGAYWNLTPLWAMSYPEYYNDWIQSQLLVFDDAGWLGDGIACSRYVSGVGTNMVPIAIAGAFHSGIRNYDVMKAFSACLKNELGVKERPEGAGKKDVEAFLKNSYVPYNDSIPFGSHEGGSQFSVSHTLEYCFSAYAVAQFAHKLGRDADYKSLMQLSHGWEQLFDDSLLVVRPRDSKGTLLEPFDPHEPWRGFQEGNAIQYTYYVPQDPLGLIIRMGRSKFVQRLDSLFMESRKLHFGGGTDAEAFAGIVSPYNHGNQPCLHIAWLFNFAGEPWKTQKWTRIICDEFYGNTGRHGYGWGQDEDQGQLGAWYVLTALGLFDVQGGTTSRPTFQIGSPIFDHARVKLSPENAQGKEFVVETVNNAPENYYIQSATLNGKPLDRSWIYRDEFFRGGKLRLYMGPKPSHTWGTSPAPYDRLSAE